MPKAKVWVSGSHEQIDTVTAAIKLLEYTPDMSGAATSRSLCQETALAASGCAYTSLQCAGALDGPLVAQGVIVLRNLRHDAKRKSRLSALMCLLPAASYPGAGERDRL